MATVIERLQTLRPSAKAIKQGTNWPDFMVEDYLTMFENLIILATSDDSVIVKVEKNTADIIINKDDITLVNSELDTHEANDSAHGVIGDNIGTGDFAQAALGGAVLLSTLVADAVASTVSVDSPDAAVAPVAYDQAQVQSIVTLANDLKSDVNQLTSDLNAAITQLNDMIAKSKLAKQMAET